MSETPHNNPRRHRVSADNQGSSPARKQQGSPGNSVRQHRADAHVSDRTTQTFRQNRCERSDRNTTAYQRDVASYQQRKHQNTPQSPSFPLKPALIAAVLLVCLVGGGIAFASTRPVAIILNGTSLELGGSKDIAALISEGLVTPTPGDFIAVDSAVLEAGKGREFSAWINGADVDDPATKLKSGDIVTLANGADIMEDSDDTVVAIPYEISEEGNGPIHVIEGEGADGHSTTKIGKTSGKTFIEEADPVNPVCRKYYPDTGGDKVIALTFDDGPWPGSTERVLDVLEAQGAKATFFTVGERFDDEGKALVKRAYDAGHQISTHSYDHARGDGKSLDLGLMSPEQQIEEITKGYDVIREATGADPSTVIRTPGGNYSPAVQKNLAPYISAEIGWVIDSGDWRKSGVQAIADELTSAWPGAIILCHDGGGDRSQTVEALEIALPYLKEQGYEFITIEELMQYPYKEL